MSRQPVIGILEAGRPPEALAAIHGDYPSFVRRWLAPLGARFVTHAVMDGDVPAAPAYADLWVVTGSRFGVYEDHGWIAPAEAFIRACAGGGAKVFGMCFGHQLIARAMGGVVRKSEKGWGLGVHDYAVSEWPHGGQPAKLSLQAFHQDQVEVAPPGARVIASSAFCPAAALWYPGFALSVQGHPEFTASYARALIELRRGVMLGDRDADRGVRTVMRPTDSEALACLVKDLLLGKLGSGMAV